jgi:hypothetical protein
LTLVIAIEIWQGNERRWVMGADKLEALYFPFSRSIDPASTKQMLLIFDSVHFLDPVDDESWRTKLMEHMVDPRFGGYRSIASALPSLVQEGAVVRQDPTGLASTQVTSVVAWALSDLLDSDWVANASAPGRFDIPHWRTGPNRQAVWEVFQEKLPPGFVTALSESPKLSRHILRRGDPSEAWVLSYEAGSAVAISVHLAAASELGLATVTDSPMHHDLPLSKMARPDAQAKGGLRRSGEVARHAAQRAAMRLLGDILPRPALERIEFDELLEFRERTRTPRTQFVRELQSRLGAIGRTPVVEEWDRAESELILSLSKDVREYQADLAAARDKCWPSLAGALGATLPAGGAAAIALNYLGATQHAFAAAAVAGGFAMAKGLLELRANTKDIVARVSPSVSYLSQVRTAFGS